MSAQPGMRTPPAETSATENDRDAVMKYRLKLGREGATNIRIEAEVLNATVQGLVQQVRREFQTFGDMIQDLLNTILWTLLYADDYKDENTKKRLKDLITHCAHLGTHAQSIRQAKQLDTELSVNQFRSFTPLFGIRTWEDWVAHRDRCEGVTYDVDLDCAVTWWEDEHEKAKEVKANLEKVNALLSKEYGFLDHANKVCRKLVKKLVDDATPPYQGISPVCDVNIGLVRHAANHWTTMLNNIAQ